MFTAPRPSAESPTERFHPSSAWLLVLSLVGVMCLPEIAACAGTASAAPFRRAKLTASDEFECAPADIREVGGMEWTGHARYALEACGQRHTYECDETTCTRVCDYVPVASSFAGEGPAEGDHGEFVARWAAAEFGCNDVRQVERTRDRYTLAVCGQEVVYDCDEDEGCARRCE